MVTAALTDSKLKLSVWNEGDRSSSLPVNEGGGTGLSRLRERLAILYGEAAQLISGARDDGSYEATLIVPRRSVA